MVRNRQSWHLRCLYPQDKGIAVDFSTDRNLSATFADWLSVRQTLAETEKLEAKLKQTLQQAMGEASRAIFETGEVTWKKAKDSVVLDTARLLADQPDLLKTYGMQRQGSRRFVLA
jgi:predicted phage-related endonuclease